MVQNPYKQLYNVRQHPPKPHKLLNFLSVLWWYKFIDRFQCPRYPCSREKGILGSGNAIEAQILAYAHSHHWNMVHFCTWSWSTLVPSVFVPVDQRSGTNDPGKSENSGLPVELRMQLFLVRNPEIYGVPSPPKSKVNHNIQLDSLTINLASINIIFHSSTLYFVSQSLKLWTSTFKVTVQHSTFNRHTHLQGKSPGNEVDF